MRLHEGSFRVELAADGSATFIHANGHVLEPSPTLPRVPADHAERVSTPAQPWRGTDWTARRIDYGYVVSALVARNRR